MTVDTGRSWAEQVEAAIRSLRDVDLARVRIENGKIREVHVLTRSERPAKQFVRDVQTLLLTRFGHSIDHRVVSVASQQGRHPDASHPAMDGGAALDMEIAAEPRPQQARADDRIRFVSVNLYVSGPRAQSQVELRWKGITRMGSASGAATREGSHLLVAEATVAALEEFLEEDWALGVNAVQFVPIGKREAVVVGLTLLAHRQEKTLAGCCTVEQDVPQAVALATLAALNRVVGGLETREPVEYVLRPTSFPEASEAK